MLIMKTLFSNNGFVSQNIDIVYWTIGIVPNNEKPQNNDFLKIPNLLKSTYYYQM